MNELCIVSTWPRMAICEPLGRNFSLSLITLLICRAHGS